MEKIHFRVFEVIEPGENPSRLSAAFDIFIITLIIINVILVIADTFSGIPYNIRRFFYAAEIVSVVIFTIEYILRLWISDKLYPKKQPVVARIRYIFSFMALIDLFAILPFYLPLVFTVDLRVLRMFRLLRLLRLLKMNRYITALVSIGNVIKSRANQLLSSLFVMALLMIMSSVLMYYLEYPAQPESFENALSGLWWVTSAIAKVQYGASFPLTNLGRVLGAVIALLGVGLVAVPTGIISAGFLAQSKEEKEQKAKQFCPYCGENIE